MESFEDFSLASEEFSGTVRLFPLPNLVLFPNVMQPIHVFEPRYRELLEDALEGDRLIAMGVLTPGWEQDYEGRPPLYPMACLGRVATSCRLEDGTYNVLLLGLKRVRLLGELDEDRTYRTASVELCEDRYLAESSIAAAEMQYRLRRAFLKILPLLSDAQDQLEHLLDNDVNLGVLTDVIGYVLDIGIAAKERLLSEVDVYRRAELLLSYLDDSAPEQRKNGVSAGAFPPQFSAN